MARACPGAEYLLMSVRGLIMAAAGHGLGNVWQAATIPSGGFQYSSMAFGGGKFVAVGSGPSADFAVSSNGKTWSLVSVASLNWASVAYGAGTFVAVQGNGATTTSLYSTNGGVTWNSTPNNAPSGWNSVAYGNGRFVAVGGSVPNDAFAVSSDGISWATLSLPTGFSTSGGFLTAWVAYGGGQFIVQNGSGHYLTSPDGVTWTTRGPGGAGNANVGAVYGNGIWVVPLGGIGAAVLTSPDGITWTSRTLPSLGWTIALFGNGIFVLLGGSNSQCLTSTNGVNWNTRTLPYSMNWSAGAYGNVGGNGVFALSGLNGIQAAFSVS
jgi:hypothetical protein